MTTLVNFPIVPQRTPITADGKPSENAELDCVPACLCAGAMYLNHVDTIGDDYTPDTFKDAAYGDAYVGGTDASAYVDYCAKLGIRLWHFDAADNADLVDKAHKQIQAGHPVIFTEPNSYGNPSFTHLCVFFAEDEEAGTLTCMDPWIADRITRTDSEWQQLLIDHQLWIMENMTTEDASAFFLFGPFLPIIFFTLLMRSIEFKAPLKRREFLLLFASSSRKTGDVLDHMSGFGS